MVCKYFNYCKIINKDELCEDDLFEHDRKSCGAYKDFLDDEVNGLLRFKHDKKTINKNKKTNKIKSIKRGGKKHGRKKVKLQNSKNMGKKKSL